MENNIYIINTEEFNKKKDEIIRDGVSELVVLSDFDSTLTYASMISVLREGDGYLDDEYSSKASLLAKKYFPILEDPTIKEEEKNVMMEKWYTDHFKLLIEKRLNKRHLEKIINEPKIKLRDNADIVLSFLSQHKIPLVIISANILGGEPILMFLNKENMLYSNVEVISNSLLWDKDENAIDYKKPILLSANKDRVLLNRPSYLNRIKDRKNVLLLGDTLDDVSMVGNLEYKNLIEICFLNNKTNEKINDYKKAYDVLILNDSSMEFVSEFLKELKTG